MLHVKTVINIQDMNELFCNAGESHSEYIVIRMR